MNYFEHLTRFFNIASFRKLAPSTRLTFHAILYKWNAFRQPKSFKISDIELADLTGLSRKTIIESRRTLQNLRFIKFKATPSGVVYNLTDVTTPQQPTSQLAKPQASFTTQKPSIDKNISIENARKAQEFLSKLQLKTL